MSCWVSSSSVEVCRKFRRLTVGKKTSVTNVYDPIFVSKPKMSKFYFQLPLIYWHQLINFWCETLIVHKRSYLSSWVCLFQMIVLCMALEMDLEQELQVIQEDLSVCNVPIMQWWNWIVPRSPHFYYVHYLLICLNIKKYFYSINKNKRDRTKNKPFIEQVELHLLQLTHNSQLNSNKLLNNFISNERFKFTTKIYAISIWK